MHIVVSVAVHVQPLKAKEQAIDLGNLSRLSPQNLGSLRWRERSQTMAAGGRIGTSMGGSIVRVPRRKKPAYNDSLCTVCFSVTGGPCTRRPWERKGPRYRSETHKTSAKKRKLEWPMDEDTAKALKLSVRGS